MCLIRRLLQSVDVVFALLAFERKREEIICMFFLHRSNVQTIRIYTYDIYAAIFLLVPVLYILHK